MWRDKYTYSTYDVIRMECSRIRTRLRYSNLDSSTYTIRCRCHTPTRHYKQHEIANRNRHTSRHVPFYFSIVGQNRHVPHKDGKKYNTKFNRNVRPKGTHSHFKFYR